MDYKMLGKRLKEIRKMRDMSQQDLSYEIEYATWRTAAQRRAWTLS